MTMGLRGAPFGAAAIAVVMLSGVAARAVPVSFSITGSCSFACNVGTQFSGVMDFDQTTEANSQIISSQFTGFRYSLNGAASVTPSFRYATGEWGSTPGSMQNLIFNTGTTVLPALGGVAQASLNGNADGSLAGILIFSQGGACTTAACSQVQASIEQSNFNVVATRITGSEPPPVPLPPTLALALAGCGALGGAAIWRRRRV